MSSENRPEVPLTAQASDRRKRVRKAFEDAWRRGERPELADYLPAAGPDRLPILVELAHMDLDYRITAGETVRVEDYLRRYPDLKGDAVAVVGLIVAEWQLRGQRTKVTVEEYLQRFPPYREKLLTRLSVSDAADRTNDEEGCPPRDEPVCAATLATLSPIEYVDPLDRPSRESCLSESPGSEARLIGRLERPSNGVRRSPLLVGVLVLLGLGLVVGYSVTYQAYRTADARRLDAERADRDSQTALKQEQGALGKERGAAREAEAARQEEGRRRRRAESEREQGQIALYARQLAEARRLVREGGAEQARAVLNQCRPELRHWEWRYLRRLCRDDRAGALMLDHYFVADAKGDRGVSLSVLTGTFSPDGKSLVSVASDPEHTRSELRLWDLATGRAVRTYPCPGLLCSSACLSADGQVLAAMGSPNSGGPSVVRLWKTNSGEELPTLRRQGHDIAALAFGPDGSWLVTRGKEGATRVWEVASGKERCHCEGRAAADADVAVSPDGKQIVSVGGAVHVFDPTACKDLKGLPVGDFQAVGAAFSSDGKWLALSGVSQGRDAVRLWHPPSGQQLLTLQDFGGKVYFSPDGRYLVALGSRFARLWDSRTGRTRTVAGMGLHVIHPDGLRALLQRDGRFEIRSLESPAEYRVVGDAAVSVVPGPNGTPRAGNLRLEHETPNTIPLAATYGSPVLSGDGRRLAAAYRDGRVRVWDLASGRQIHAVPAPLSLSLGLNHDGTHLATAGPKAGMLVVWDADTGTERCHVTYKGTVSRLTFSRTGGLLAVSTASNRGELTGGHRPADLEAAARHGERAELSVWETATGEKRFTLSGASATEFLSVVISPDEKQILDFTPGRDLAVRGWDLLTGQRVARKLSFSSGSPPVLSPDGRHIVCYGPTASNPRAEVCVADVASGALLWSARPDSNDINGLAFSPDGRRLAASCAKGGRVRIWEMQTGQEVFILSAHAHYADAVRFTSDGQHLITLGLEGLTTRSYTVKQWDGSVPP